MICEYLRLSQSKVEVEAKEMKENLQQEPIAPHLQCSPCNGRSLGSLNLTECGLVIGDIGVLSKFHAESTEDQDLQAGDWKCEQKAVLAGMEGETNVKQVC